jgi:hypothetical protein
VRVDSIRASHSLFGETDQGDCTILLQKKQGSNTILISISNIFASASLAPASTSNSYFVPCIRLMQVVPFILMGESTEALSSAKSNNSKTKESVQSPRKSDKPDAPATLDTTFSPADAALFRPSVLNAQSASALLKSVDGPSLEQYTSKECVYVGRSVPIAAGSSLAVPIHVATPGSMVEYAVEIAQYDIAVAIAAEREEGTTVVRVSTQ